jgi:hypothetical protein
MEHAVVEFCFHKTVVDDIARRDAIFMLPRLYKDICNYIYIRIYCRPVSFRERNVSCYISVQ